LDPEHPRRTALGDNPVQHRSKIRSSWRVEAVKTVESLSLQDLPRADIPSPFVKPWTDEESPGRTPNWTVFPELPEPRKPQTPTYPLVAPDETPWGRPTSTTPDENNATVEQVVRLIDSYEIDTTIYTDGSCSEGTKDGGSAAVITTGSARNPVVLETIQKRGGTFTCSFQEEKDAMGLALNWMKDNQFTDTIICSDSQSLLRALKHSTPDTADLRNILDNLRGNTYIHWVPSHSKIPGNEIADIAAKEATKIDGTPTAVTFGSAKSVIKRLIKDPSPTHHVVKETYKHLQKKKEKNIIKSRKEAATLAQLRSGHCLKLAAYRHRIDNTKSDICPRCQEDTEDVKHWLKCPANLQDRLNIFGRTDVGLGALTEFPAEALAYAKATFPVESTGRIPL
jgi:ribonuclease HI